MDGLHRVYGRLEKHLEGPCCDRSDHGDRAWCTRCKCSSVRISTSSTCGTGHTSRPARKAASRCATRSRRTVPIGRGPILTSWRSVRRREARRTTSSTQGKRCTRPSSIWTPPIRHSELSYFGERPCGCPPTASTSRSAASSPASATARDGARPKREVLLHLPDVGWKQDVVSRQKGRPARRERRPLRVATTPNHLRGRTRRPAGARVL